VKLNYLVREVEDGRWTHRRHFTHLSGASVGQRQSSFTVARAIDPMEKSLELLLTVVKRPFASYADTARSNSDW
jgi:hypothetical protein